MSAGVSQQFAEDSILDQLLTEDGSKSVVSFVDGQNFIKPYIEKWLVIDNDIQLEVIVNKLAVKLAMFNTTTEIPKDGAIGSLLKLTKTLTVNDKLLVLYTRVDKVGYLSIRVPKLDSNNETSNKTLASLLQLAGVMHSVRAENIRLLVDEKLDASPLALSGSMIKLLSKLLSSAQNPYGGFDGPDVVWGERSTFKSTPPGLLAAMRLLQQKDVLIRKITYKKGSKLRPLTAHELQEQFNTIFLLKKTENESFAVKLTKAILASATKPSNKGFPGGFVHSNRVKNGVKNDSSLLTILGWTPKVLSQTRLLDCLFNTVDDSYGQVEGKTKIIGRSLQNISKKGRNFSFQEFRTACVLTCPRLDFSSESSYEDQLKVDPLDNKIEENVIKRFEDNTIQKIVDLNQQTYALKINLNNPKSKVTLAGYENVRNRLLASTANVPIKDAKGTSYETFSKLPEKAQTFLRKRFRYPVKKRSREEQTEVQTEQSVQMEVDTSVPSPAEVRPLKRSRTMTKRQAAESRARVITRSFSMNTNRAE
jgi:hypothetical protein